MKLLLLVHRDDAALQRLIDAARLERIAGFTILPSRGVGKATQAHPTEFSIGGLFNVLQGDRLENTTVLSLIEDDRVPRMLELVRAHLTDLDQPGGGVYAVLPVDAFGSLE